MIAIDPVSTPSEREALITGHWYLCGRAARKFLRSGNDRNDLEQVAAIGLIKAADRYDAAHGTPFEAYAWVLILGELMHYVRDSERPVRAPRRLQEIERRWNRAERELWNELGREPRDREIAQKLHLSKYDENDFRRYKTSSTVLSVEGLRPSQQGSLSYTIDAQLDRLVIEAGFATLTTLERKVLRFIYEHDTPIAVIAERLGYSRRHVTRLRKSALKKLAPLALEA
jgi:RNA polymerase sigma-B factor